MMRDISLHIMDIIQNSIAAEAKNIRVTIKTDADRRVLTVSVSDDGHGMNDELLSNVASPFTTTRNTRNVGLGIPLFKLSGEIAGGDFRLDSREGHGTDIEVSYQINNINRIPLGDVGETITSSMLSQGGVDFEVVLDNGSNTAVVSTKEIAAHLEGVPLTDFNVLAWIKEYINENVKNIFHGILEEV